MKANLTAKKLLTLCLVTAILCSGFCTFASASVSENTSMDNIDIILSAHYFLKTDNSDETFWKENDSISEVIPLYNQVDDIVAYYVKLEQGGYVVINNNSKNPAAIEFGKNDNPLIREILDNDSDPHIIYSHPLRVCNIDGESPVRRNESLAQETELYDYYPELQQENIALSTIIADCKKELLKKGSLTIPFGDGDYGFIPEDEMPTGHYEGQCINCDNVNWVVYDDFNDIANNHCAAVAVTNMALYFAEQGYSNLYQGSNRLTFVDVHNILGNGPVGLVGFSGGADEYFSNCGYTLQSNGVEGFDGLVTAVKKGRPVAILLADGIFEWHWILGVGWRSYDTVGGDYIQIMNGWNRDVDRFYRESSGSLVMGRLQYWI